MAEREDFLMRIRSKANAVQATLLSDLKDNINHGICVSNLTYLLAQSMDYDESICYELAIAGLVHDIGKLKLSRYLYGRSEDKYDIDDVEYMKMHSEMSYEILKDYDLSDIVMDAVLYHHENYNGSGYPYNLKGEDIPFGARVMRIADTFTALISDRPYRRAFDMESAMQIIIDEIDCYDMEVFLAFQRLIHEESTIDVINGGKILIDVSVRDIMKK